MYPLPKPVDIQKRNYLLVPEYNSFCKPKWPKILSYNERDQLYENYLKQKIEATWLEGPIRNNNFGNDYFFVTIDFRAWKPNDFETPTDPFDNRNEFYVIDRNT